MARAAARGALMWQAQLDGAQRRGAYGCEGGDDKVRAAKVCRAITKVEGDDELLLVEHETGCPALCGAQGGVVVSDTSSCRIA